MNYSEDENSLLNKKNFAMEREIVDTASSLKKVQKLPSFY